MPQNSQNQLARSLHSLASSSQFVGTTSDVSPLIILDPLSVLALTSVVSGERMTPENPACCETTYDDVLSSFTVRCNGGASFHRRRDTMPQDGQHHPNRQDDRHHRPEPPVCLLHLPPMASHCREPTL